MMETTMKRRPFGTAPTGEAVEVLSLSKGTLSCEVLTYGASLRTLCVPDRNGKPVDVVLGYDDMELYGTLGGHFGAVCGRFANRIADGKFELDGKTYQLETNNGVNHLHGGFRGFSKRVWEVESLSENAVTLSMDSPDGDANYPGHLRVKVTYTLEDNTLSLRYQATTEGATPVNLTNHTYFNLAGHDSGDVLDQTIQLFCSAYTPADAGSIPRGAIESVEGTPFDLREPTAIGAKIEMDNEQLKQGKGYDHNLIVDGENGVIRPVAKAWSDKTGIVLSCETDLPGVQFYTGNGISPRAGKNGASYAPRQGFCLETQYYPNSPNVPTFPSCILRPGEELDTTTRFIFTLA